MIPPTDSNRFNAADPSPLLAREEGNEIDNVPHVLISKPEKEEQVHLPTSTKLCGDVKRWIRQFRRPLWVVVANLMSLLLVHSLLSIEFNGANRSYHYHPNPPTTESENPQFRTTLRVGWMISLITFLWDSYIFLQGARKLEQKIKEQERGGPKEGSQKEEADGADYLELSRRVDSPFGCSSSTNTFLVYLLYALFSLAAWQSVRSGTALLQVQSMPTGAVIAGSFAAGGGAAFLSVFVLPFLLS